MIVKLSADQVIRSPPWSFARVFFDKSVTKLNAYVPARLRQGSEEGF